jgi:uncharacterized phage protein (TIGR01671 family)
MKEIKFRAWDANIKAFHLWDSESQPYGNIFWSMTKDENMPVDQFTGLKDRNGKEIFEGDIVKMHTEFYVRGNPDDDDCAHDMDYTGVVVILASKGACIKNPKTYCYLSGEHDILKGYKYVTGIRSEIIGNIYQNPELLKPGK